MAKLGPHAHFQSTDGERRSTQDKTFKKRYFVRLKKQKFLGDRRYLGISGGITVEFSVNLISRMASFICIYNL